MQTEKQLELFPRSQYPQSLVPKRTTAFTENCKWCGQMHVSREKYVECMNEFLNR